MFVLSFRPRASPSEALDRARGLGRGASYRVVAEIKDAERESRNMTLFISSEATTPTRERGKTGHKRGLRCNVLLKEREKGLEGCVTGRGRGQTLLPWVKSLTPPARPRLGERLRDTQKLKKIFVKGRLSIVTRASDDITASERATKNQRIKKKMIEKNPDN